MFATGRSIAVIGGVLAGLCLGIAGSTLWQEFRKGDGELRIVSDCDGALKEICIHYVRSFNSESIETIADLLCALPPDVALRVVVADRSEFEFLRGQLRMRGADRMREMTAVVTGEPVTPWAKDRFGTFITESGVPVIGVPPVRALAEGPRTNDEKVPERLARELKGVECRSLPFMFEGGDLLSDSTNIYAAATIAGRNQPFSGQHTGALMNLIGTVCGRKVIAIGRNPGDVPDHHIGMYCTALCEGSVAVGDPAAGRELLRNTRESGVTAEPDQGQDVLFRNVRTALSSNGLRVVTLPLLLTDQPRVYVTYNNAIIERRGSEKRVYMPIYGLPALDGAARRIYEAEGFKVFPVRVGKLYRNTGSLRCMVGIIKRG